MDEVTGGVKFTYASWRDGSVYLFNIWSEPILNHLCLDSFLDVITLSFFELRKLSDLSKMREVTKCNVVLVILLSLTEQLSDLKITKLECI